MSTYEYAVVPAPKRGLKARGLKSTEDRFANAMQTVMNEYGAAGWEYVRSDTLPCEERTGFTGRSTTFQNVLVFRKVIEPVQTTSAPDRYITPTAQPIATPMVAATPLNSDPGRPEPRIVAE